jgi:hypothetical protein
VRSKHRALAWLLIAFVGSKAVDSADFCQDLERVLESSQEGFAAVRGDLVSDLVDPLSSRRIVWQCTQVFSGAKTCEVVWHRQTYTYSSFWHKVDETANVATFDALSELLTGCGLDRQESSKTGRSQWFTAQGQAGLEIVLARNARRVRLSFTAEGYPGP